MKTKLSFFTFLVIVSFSTVTKAQINIKDSLALVDLYNSTNGANWVNNTNWLTTQPAASWKGIVIVNHRVQSIDLGFNYLTGTLPASIGNFDSLTVLLLNHNVLKGTLPASVGKLKVLDTMDLEYNYLSGSIPASVGNMTHLIFFNADFNYLSGDIPDAIGNCAYLTTLSFYYNKLTGNIPVSFKKLTRLQVLGLSHNQLSGILQDIFVKGGPMTDFNISHNQFTGSIFPVMGTLTQLTNLYLDQNHFTGQIPESLGNLKKLQHLHLWQNELSGSIPAGFANLPDIQELYLFDNQLSEENNPQYTGTTNPYVVVAVHKNRFTFNGLEALKKKYLYVTYNPQAPIAIHPYKNGLAVSAGGTLSNNTYKWFKTDQANPVTITGDSTFVPAASGRYFARVTNAILNGLILHTDTVSYTLPATNSPLSLTAYPNPAQDVIAIAGLSNRHTATLAIADARGYVWIHKTIGSGTSVQCNISKLKAGNYMVTVTNGKEICTVQFVKE